MLRPSFFRLEERARESERFFMGLAALALRVAEWDVCLSTRKVS